MTISAQCLIFHAAGASTIKCIDVFSDCWTGQENDLKKIHHADGKKYAIICSMEQCAKQQVRIFYKVFYGEIRKLPKGENV